MKKLLMVLACMVSGSMSLAESSSDPVKACSLENVERCREENTKDCKSVIGLMCSEAGREAFKNKKYAAAQPYLNRACRLEVGEACFILGNLELAREKRSRARVYYLSGCQFASDKSCDALLKMGGRDPGAKVAHNSSAPEQGAVNQVGAAWLRNNMGVETPCQGLNAEACFQQGAALAKTGDIGSALQTLTVACDKKHSGACNRVGWEWKKQKQVAKSLPFFEKACSMGERKGCNNLAWHHEKEFRMDLAIQYYAQACTLGHNKACVRKNELSR